MFLNFICSCKQHNITINNVLVFVSNEEIVPIVEATGSIAIYHESFAVVSKKASEFYLDKIFSDMMWYKAFSVWLIIKLKYNVLFQVKF